MYCCFDGAPIDSEEEFDAIRKMSPIERSQVLENIKRERKYERS